MILALNIGVFGATDPGHRIEICSLLSILTSDMVNRIILFIFLFTSPLFADCKDTKDFFESNIVSGNINQFKKNNIFIGTELAFNLDLKEGDNINLMSSAFVATPLGSLPKQETFKISGIFSTGFIEFDQNIIFLNIEDALSIFDKDIKDQNLEIYLKNPLEANIYKKKN